MTDDGHYLRIVALRSEGRPSFDIDCPGPPTCRAHWQDPDSDEAAREPCWLRYWFKEDDAADECIDGDAQGEGPYALAWHFNGEYVDYYIGTAREKRL